MPSLNQAEFIGRAIESVLSQDYPHIELIVADGGSEDGTITILEQHRARDARLRWFSRNDHGPAHALNDALSSVRGTTIGWLNSDDLYTPGAVRRAQNALDANGNWLMVYGLGQHIDTHDTVLNDYPTLPPSTPVHQFSQGCFICQPTMFFRRSACILLGKLDETMKASFDFDYWMRAFSAFPERIGFVDAVQAYSRLHDACITLRMRRTVALEGMRVLARYLGSAPKEWLLTYVDELLAEEADGAVLPNMQEHVQLAIDEAAAWMTLNEKNELEAAVRQRLQ